MSEQCRIMVSFNGHRPLSYQAEVSAAHRFAEAIQTMGAHVTIDTDMTGELRPLPCEQLWAS